MLDLTRVIPQMITGLSLSNGKVYAVDQGTFEYDQIDDVVTFRCTRKKTGDYPLAIAVGSNVFEVIVQASTIIAIESFVGETALEEAHA